MQQKSIIITAIVLAIAVALGTLYLLSAPALNVDDEITPSPTTNPNIAQQGTPTPLSITSTTPTPLKLAQTTPTPQPTPNSTPTVIGSSVTAETGTSEWLLAILFAAVIFGSLGLIIQFKKA